MARKQKPPTDAEIHNSAVAIGGESPIIWNDAEAVEKEKRIKARIDKATDSEIIRLFIDSTEAALTTKAFDYFPYMPKEKFNSLYYKAAACISIKEDYNLLRIINLRIEAFYSDLYSFIGDYQSAAYYLAAVRAYNNALEALKSDTGIIIPKQIEKGLISDLSYFSKAYSGYIYTSDKDTLLIDVDKALKNMNTLLVRYKDIQRDAKTRLSAISDTIEVLDIADIIDKPTKELIATIEKNIGTTEKSIKSYIYYLRKFTEKAGGDTPIDADTEKAFTDLNLAYTPFNRAHAYTDKYRNYVAGYFQGKPGDKGLGDKFLKEVAKYKRNKKY